MSVTNPVALNMAVPYKGIDNIIGIHNGSFSIAAPTLATFKTNASDPFITGFNDTCLFEGIFSVDGGTTWNDFGVNVPNLTTPTAPVLQTVTCQGYISPAGVFTAYSSNFYDLVHSVGTAYTIQYKVVFFAKDNQGSINPIPTKQILVYESVSNFQKIYLKGSVPDTGGIIPINHNLGYVPKVRAWFVTPTTFGTAVANSLYTYDWVTGGGATNTAYVNVDTSVVDFTSLVTVGLVSSATIIYRIYLDT